MGHAKKGRKHILPCPNGERRCGLHSFAFEIKDDGKYGRKCTSSLAMTFVTQGTMNCLASDHPLLQIAVPLAAKTAHVSLYLKGGVLGAASNQSNTFRVHI